MNQIICRMKRLSVLLLLVAPSLVLSDQAPGRVSVQYELGLGYSASREDLLVPLAFRGGGLMGGLAYNQQLPRLTLELKLRAKLDFVFNRFGHPGALIVYAVHPAILSTPRPLGNGEFRYGVSVPVQLRNQFLFSWDDAHLYWLTTRGVNLELEHRFRWWREKQFRARISLPLVSWVSRPESYRYEKQDASLNWLGLYSPEENRQFTLTGLSEYQSLDVDLSLFRPGSPGVWTFRYSYAHYTQPQEVWVAFTTISYSRTFKRWGSR